MGAICRQPPPRHAFGPGPREPLLQESEQPGLKMAFFEAEVGTRGSAPCLELRLSPRADDDDHRRVRPRLDDGGKLDGIHRWQPMDREDEFRTVPLDRSQGFSRRCRRFDPDRAEELAQPIRDDRAGVEAVVDQEYSHGTKLRRGGSYVCSMPYVKAQPKGPPSVRRRTDRPRARR